MVLKKLFSVSEEQNGAGPLRFSWQSEGNLLAVVGSRNKVTIVDRQGTTVKELDLPGTTPVVALSWDMSGELLAIAQEKSATFTIYSSVTQKKEDIDSGLKDITFISWNRQGPQLALGSGKGQLMIYNRQTHRKTPLTGVHTKRIIGGAWSVNGVLATIGEDRILAFLDVDGNVLDTITTKNVATTVSFPSDADSKGPKGSGPSNVCCVNMGGKSLLFQNSRKKGDPPVEIIPNAKYGTVVSYQLYGEGYVLIGFSSGQVQVLSTHSKEMGEEVSTIKAHKESLVSVCYCTALRKGCSVGDGVVRVFDMDDNKITDNSEKAEIDHTLDTCDWTEDGQILTVTTKHGKLYCFLTKVPTMNDSFGLHLAYLSSLREITVRNVETESVVCKIPIDVEPTSIAVGVGVAAASINNQTFLYNFSKGNSKAAGNKTYSGIVDNLKLNGNFSVALVEGRLHIHPISTGKGSSRQEATLPEKDSGKITSFKVTENFVMYATQGGNLGMFSLIDFQMVMDYKHNGNGIRHISTNASGTRIAFIDTSNAGFILNPTSEVTTTIENFNASTKKLVWDTSDYGVLLGIDTKTIITYCYSPNSRHGPVCEPVYQVDPTTYAPTAKFASTNLPHRSTPLCMFKGSLFCQTASSSIAQVSLASHKLIYSNSKRDGESFVNNLQLNRLPAALSLATKPEQLQIVAKRALHLLDIELAIRVYRSLSQPTLVMCLEKIRHIKEKNILLGHVSMISGNFNDAQNFFTRSSRPILALEMRRDLLQWEHALQLAKTLAVDQVPHMSKEYAQQLEYRGEYSKALDHYRTGKMKAPTGHQSAELDAETAAVNAHNAACEGGLARCMIRTGAIRDGVQVAQGLKDIGVALECAKILESMNQYEEAGAMYEVGDQPEKAATLYITETKNLKAAGRLLPKLTSRNVLVMYAKAKENQEQAYAEAEAAYTQAEDWDNVVRLKVERQNDLHGAYKIVRKTRSTDAASMVAAMCRKKKEYGPAVEFLVLAKKTQEAFELAEAQGCMTNFEEALIGQVAIKDGVAPKANRDDFLLIAQHYDSKKKPMQAGQYYEVAASYANAMDRFMSVNTTDSVSRAVEVAGRARSDALTNKLIDFLMGEVDNEPKDPSYIFKLYMALGNFEKAAKTSVIIATKSQESGNYRAAHRSLVETALVLQEKKIRIPADLRRNLMLVHSYLIVKHIVSPLDDMDNATRMLLRVARNIRKFPAHAATILTSTILQCIKVGFKSSAYEYACIVIQNDKYKAEMNEKHRKKVESLVRKRGKEEMGDPMEHNTPCPICEAPVPETVLDCGSCKNTLPMCVVTGKHMVLEEWSGCPTCKFPALFGPFSKLVSETKQCPLCEAAVTAGDLSIHRNPDVKSFA